MTTPSHISPLPLAITSHLRSSLVVTSLAQLVLELVQNALDAQAAAVDVLTDIENWGARVHDNGTGITRRDLKELGRRYVTSKSHDVRSLAALSTFGFRGEALASTADLAMIEITSRHESSPDSHTLILKGGETLYFGPTKSGHRAVAGTTVIVRDLFYKGSPVHVLLCLMLQNSTFPSLFQFPVRRKSAPPQASELDKIKRGVEACALLFPQVTFTISERGREAPVRTIPRTKSTLGAFRALYGKAAAERVEEISVERGAVRVQGFISFQGVYSKSYQFIFVNNHLLASSDLHRAISGVFARSTFSKHADDAIRENTPERTKSASKRTPRKAAERRPIYVLSVTLPPSQLDNLLEPTKSAMFFEDASALTALLTRIVSDFLVKHHFLSAVAAEAAQTDSAKTRRRAAPAVAEMPLLAKRAHAERGGCCGGCRHGEGEEDESPSFPRCKRARTEVPNTPIVHPTASYDEAESASPIRWTDPTTQRTFLIDRRTGHSFPADGPSLLGEPDATRPQTVATRRSLGGALTPSARDEPMPEWLGAVLQGWENPVFVPTGTDVPTLSPMPSSRTVPRPSAFSRFFLPSEPRSSSQRFSSSSLRTMRVIAQIDRKFVACVLERSLILLDQHAADERIRVERFLRELCLGYLRHSHLETHELDPPLGVLLARPEAERLRGEAERAEFARWGVRVEVEEGLQEKEGNYAQVWVQSVPAVVKDRLGEQRMLQDLLQEHLAAMAGAGGVVRRDGVVVEDDAEHDWLRALRACPKVLLDLVNSKACRGAIMFGDSLSTEQCERLLAQLADTVFPFQCAHGRPSLVPIMDLDTNAFGAARMFSLANGYAGWERTVDWAAFS